jgi:hypothetical protein
LLGDFGKNRHVGAIGAQRAGLRYALAPRAVATNEGV